MSENGQQSSSSQTFTQSSGNFDQRADKWWESRWAFIMAVAVPLLAVAGMWTQLRLSDSQQMDRINNLTAQFTLFRDGDFKDSEQRITDLTTSVNQLTVQIGEMEVILNNDKLPQK